MRAVTGGDPPWLAPHQEDELAAGLEDARDLAERGRGALDVRQGVHAAEEYMRRGSRRKGQPVRVEEEQTTATTEDGQR